MNSLNVNNKIILRLDNVEISKDFVEDFKKDKIEIIKSSEYIRLEHPHCAFFKGIHSVGDKELSRTTLYTPEGRLHVDCEIQEDKEVRVNNYVKKQEHMDVLLFYLRDLEVKPAFKESNQKTMVLQMPQTPMMEFVNFVDNTLLEKVMLEYEINAKHILSQLRRIYNAKIEILNQKLKGKAQYAIFDELVDMDISFELIERWHYYYVRKARLLK